MKRTLIEHAAPTLAGLKTANMFNYKFKSKEQLTEELILLNRELNEKGLYLDVLRESCQTVLLYVYRKNQLLEELKEVRTRQLLTELGYHHQATIPDLLNRLKQRLSSSDEFPHEIGVFLGYPFEDVLGFITNCGSNCKCCGYWKVYGDEQKAKRLFGQFTKCREIYLKLYLMGRSINQLIVSV